MQRSILAGVCVDLGMDEPRAELDHDDLLDQLLELLGVVIVPSINGETRQLFHEVLQATIVNFVQHCDNHAEDLLSDND